MLDTTENKYLIILGGLPGTGKTTIARLLSEKIGAMHLRIDTIEASIKRSFPNTNDLKEAGYLIAYDLAKDNLRLGHVVIADSVNPIQITRKAWRNVATESHTDFIEIEFICSDSIEHKNRIETRSSDITGQILPTWEKVQNRDYQSWNLKGLQIDTATSSPESCVDEIIKYLKVVKLL